MAEEAPTGRLPALEALRELLTERLIADEDRKQTAALARQLREVLREIDELNRGRKKGSIVDELAARRTDGRPGAPRARAAGGGRPNSRS